MCKPDTTPVLGLKYPLPSPLFERQSRLYKDLILSSHGRLGTQSYFIPILQMRQVRFIKTL